MMPAANLSSYDWIVVNSSGGKDSQAMLSELVRRCAAEGVPKSRIVVAHADLGRVEWKGTKDLAETQAKVLGLRFEAIARPQGDLLEHVENRGMWPSSDCRYCTSDHKRGQVGKIFTMLARETRALGPCGAFARILDCQGIRAEESAARAKKLPFFRNQRATGKGNAKVVDTYYPIFTWTTEQVWDTIRTSHPRLPHHYAYDLGMPRLSCIFCVFAPKSALLIAGKQNPELLDEYVRVERAIGHTFRHGFRIEEVRDALAAGATEAGALGTEDIVSWDM